MAKRTHNRERPNQKPSNRRTLLLGLIALVAIAVVVVVVLINQPGKTAGTERPNASGMSMGDPNAPVKVEEYSDFQCPYCGAFAKNVEPGIVEKYVATGKVHFTYIPYSFIGPESVRAAEAAFCAADQGLFWQFHDVLFNSQAGENNGTFSDSNLILLAQKAGLKMTEFRPCFDNGKYRQQVQDDLKQGQDRGVTGTPYFFVNGKGPIDQTQLISTIDAALAGQ